MSTRYLFETSNSNLAYYASLNKTFRQIFGKNLMLHYPLYKEENETLEQRQVNLTHYCVGKAGDMEGKTVLEVGCGNGTQSVYLATHFRPGKVIGIDLIPENITLALEQKINEIPVDFSVDDAQRLNSVLANSVDFLFCIESAFHYPKKELFLKQIKRVLKPGGKFVIADIINKTANRTYITARWKRKMLYHHWTAEQYRSAIEEAGLTRDYEENLTQGIIMGYQGSENWVSRDKIPSFYKYIQFRLFAFIQLHINIHLLKKKEDYYLVIGSKE